MARLHSPYRLDWGKICFQLPQVVVGIHIPVVVEQENLLLQD
jgi:hypothetical protein